MGGDDISIESGDEGASLHHEKAEGRLQDMDGESRAETVPVVETDGEPSPQEVRIIPKGRLWVVEPVEPGEPITAEMVREVQNWIRDRGLED